MTEMNKQNLCARTRNAYYFKMFLLLFLFINVHKTATANLVNPQQSNENINAKKYEVCEPEVIKSFEKSLIEKIIRYGDKCVKNLDSDHDSYQLIFDKDGNNNSRSINDRLDLYKRNIAMLMDDFRVSLNKDFVTWYKQFNMKDDDKENYLNDELYSFYTIYNFTMLNTYAKYFNDAKAKKRDLQISVADMEIKYINLKYDLKILTSDTVNDIMTIYEINIERKRLNAENHRSNVTNSRSMVGGNDIKKSMPKCPKFFNIADQIKRKYMSFTAVSRIRNDTFSRDINSNKQLIRKTKENLESLLKIIEADNIFIHQYKLYIIESDSSNNREHIPDIVYKFNCFFTNVFHYTKILKNYSYFLIPSQTNALKSNYYNNLLIYTRKTNKLYDYIEYMVQNVLFINFNDKCVIDDQFYKSGKTISYIILEDYLYVFGYNPFSLKPLKVEEQIEIPKRTKSEIEMAEETPNKISKYTEDALKNKLQGRT